MSNPLPQRIQHLYVIRNMKRSYWITNSNKEKETLVALPQIFPKKIQIRIFFGGGALLNSFFLLLLFLFFNFLNGVLAADHSKNQKDSLMNLHYSHTQGRFEPLLKVRREHPPRVTPQLDTGFKSNYSNPRGHRRVCPGDFQTHF